MEATKRKVASPSKKEEGSALHDALRAYISDWARLLPASLLRSTSSSVSVVQLPVEPALLEHVGDGAHGLGATALWYAKDGRLIINMSSPHHYNFAAAPDLPGVHSLRARHLHMQVNELVVERLGVGASQTELVTLAAEPTTIWLQTAAELAVMAGLAALTLSAGSSGSHSVSCLAHAVICAPQVLLSQAGHAAVLQSYEQTALAVTQVPVRFVHIRRFGRSGSALHPTKFCR